jgi:hypothetical protein
MSKNFRDHTIPFKPLPREPQVGDRVIENGQHLGTITKARHQLSNGYDNVRIRRYGEEISWGFNICNYGSTWELEGTV